MARSRPIWPAPEKAPTSASRPSCPASGRLNEVDDAADAVEDEAVDDHHAKQGGALFPGERAQQDDGHGGQDGDQGGRQMAELEVAKARLNHEQDAGEAGRRPPTSATARPFPSSTRIDRMVTNSGDRKISE